MGLKLFLKRIFRIFNNVLILKVFSTMWCESFNRVCYLEGVKNKNSFLKENSAKIVKEYLIFLKGTWIKVWSRGLVPVPMAVSVLVWTFLLVLMWSRCWSYDFLSTLVCRYLQKLSLHQVPGLISSKSTFIFTPCSTFPTMQNSYSYLIQF